MTKNLKGTLALGALAVLAACASVPENNAMIDEAKAAYERAAGDPQVARSAPVELQRAQEALRQAQGAHAGGELAAAEHYAYLAKRRTEVAVEAGKIAAADEAVAAAGIQRQRILVDVRTREAEEQRQRAQFSLAQAEAARKQAEEQRTLAEAAQGRAAEQRAQAEASQRQAAEQLAQAEAARAAALASDQRAKKLNAQLEEMKATQTERGLVLTLSDVLFDFGRADLKAGALRTLDQLATFLNENPERNAIIEGHTDSVGSARFNQELSERRSMSVKAALVERGIAGNRIIARGFGPSKPMVGNDTPAGRQQNRRVEVVLPEIGAAPAAAGR